MAFICYGVIAKKNGVLLTKERFTLMEDTLGFDVKEDTDRNSIDYLVCLGDEDFYITLRRIWIEVYKNKNTHISTIKDMDEYYYNLFKFMSGQYYRYKVTINNITFDFKRVDEGNRYYLRFWYKGDLYEAYYGYGIDAYLSFWNKKKYYRAYGFSDSVRNKIVKFIKDGMKE